MKVGDKVRLTVKGAQHLAKTTAGYWSCANDALHEFWGYIHEVPSPGTYAVRHHALPMVRFQLDFDLIRLGRPGDRYFGRGDVKSVSSDRNSRDSFHLCYVCGEEAFLSGEPAAIKVNMDGTGFHWGVCGYCIRKMYSALLEGNAVHEEQRLCSLEHSDT